MLHILWIIIIGFLAGVVAKLMVPGKDPGGFILTTLLGVAGALIVTYLGRLVGWYEIGEAGGFVAAVIGAVLLLILYRIFKKKPGQAAQ